MVSFKFKERSLKTATSKVGGLSNKDTELLKWEGGNMRKRSAGGNTKPLGHTLHFSPEPAPLPSSWCQMAK